ncbi:uracil-DNA glycosylase family protein [Mesorhizobium sp. M0011]|uniref:uracil-DNA glycosylase family protein n=1 Tax=Mesorhizobium sp. M0011 TaxID=2956839 RepID=UPI00333A8AD5
MKLGDICAAPCFALATDFDVPGPGCAPAGLKFEDDGRQYFSVLLSNHDRRDPMLSPKIAVVGLSPAGTQISEFVKAYARTGSYVEASIRGAFAGLAADIIAMFRGVGLATKLGLRFPCGDSLARHPEVYVTSLVGCATLDTKGGSDDFDPAAFGGTRRCVLDRFLNEILDPRFSRLHVVVFLGTKARDAVASLLVKDGKSVLQTLEAAGKRVLFFPHPSPQNVEYVRLAALPLYEVPSEGSYVSERWREYRMKPARNGRRKQSEMEYKAKRRAVWNAIYDLRWEVAKLQVRP